MDEPLQRCPICYKAPSFYTLAGFWRGGCAEHIPDAVMQPVSMYAQAVVQWNVVVHDLKKSLDNR